MFFLCRAIELKRVLEACKDILGMVWFRFEPSGISFFNVDPERIVSITFTHPAGDRGTYDCEEPLGMTFCHYANTLYKILRYVGKQDMLKMTSGGLCDLRLVVFDEKEGVTKQQVQMMSLNEPIPLFQRTDHYYSCVIDLKTQHLYRIIHHLAMIGTEMTIQVVNNTIKFEADDGMGTKSSHFIKFEKQFAQIITARFYIKYAEKFLKAMVAETVWLGIDNDKPLWLYYEQPRLELKIAMLE